MSVTISQHDSGLTRYPMSGPRAIRCSLRGIHTRHARRGSAPGSSTPCTLTCAFVPNKDKRPAPTPLTDRTLAEHHPHRKTHPFWKDAFTGDHWIRNRA